MSFYRNILRQAWRLTWRNKYLWWLGIFAALLGSSGELEILLNNTGGSSGESLFPSLQRVVSTGVFSTKTISNIINLLKNDTLNIMMILVTALVVLAIFLFLVWLVTVSQAALVNISASILNQKKGSLRDGWRSGISNFWPVLLINILVRAIVYLLLIAISLPVVFSTGDVSAKLFYIIPLVIGFILTLVLSFIAKYAIAFVVINKQKAQPAIKQGWKLFKENWLISLEMSLILFFVSITLGLAIVLAILALAVPFIFLGMIFYFILSAAGGWLIAFLAFVCFMFIVIAGGAALTVFQIISWTSLFLELNKKRGTSMLSRIVGSAIKTS